MHLEDGRSLVFAALYDSWEDPEGGFLLERKMTCCALRTSLHIWMMFLILTRVENGLVHLAGEAMYTFTILTTRVATRLEWLHGQNLYFLHLKILCCVSTELL